VPLHGCGLCAAALRSATRVASLREPGSDTMTATDRRQLDPGILHSLLRRYQDEIFGHAGE
jgi:hypothetical protein